ncbi:hypothetical protein JCM11251_004455 [Rhodosporidiobolus azoricus]
MLSSSPRPDTHAHRAAAAFDAGPIAVPSSPSALAGDGELSPAFDASFASSMSITSDERGAPSPLPAHLRARASVPGSSPVVAMDISPAPTASKTVAGAGDRAALSVFGSASAAPPPRPPLFSRPHSQPPAPPSLSRRSFNAEEHPFLKSLFRAQQAESAPPTQTTFAPIAPLSVKRSSSPEEFPHIPVASTSKHTQRPTLGHYATVPPTEASKLRGPFDSGSFRFRASSSGVAPGAVDAFTDDVKGKSTAALRMPPPPSRSRSALPASWSKANRQTVAAGGLLPPPMPPLKRRSDPNIPTVRTGIESSPYRMDIDGASPNAKLASPFAIRPGQPRSSSDSRAQLSNHAFGSSSVPVLETISSPYSDENDRSGADDRLADMFGQSPGDLSPIPQSRKRLLDLENSPTPASPTPASGAGGSLGASSRRTFEKASTTASLGLHLRRQRSAVGLGVARRPSLASFASLGPAAAACMQAEAASASSVKRHATQSQDGKPAAMPARKASRRSNSVADGSFAFSSGGSSASSVSGPLSARDPNIPLESPRTLAARASISTLEECTDYFAGGRRVAAASVDLSSAAKAVMSPDNTGSPIAGFRKQEAKGKALPCFNVKEDGLMRISPETLNDLQSGHFRDGLKEYIIIDCRFDYEYDGGHIDGAINLSEHADLEARLLNISNPPEPSTSEYAPIEGKTILIFHCEFSAKRAPTCAKYVRNQDRLKNFAAYPNIHYPEVYVLQGGYEAFYKAFPERCVGGYVVMDHPEHDAKRSININKFREQKRQFNRAASFTFGQAQHASTLLRNAESSSTSNTSAFARTKSRRALEPPGFQFPLAGAGMKTGSSSFLAPPPSAAAVAASTAQLSITEEDHEGDSSFGSGNGSSPCGAMGGSPCPPSSKTMGRHSLKLGPGGGMFNPRKLGLERAATASVLTFSRS